MLIGTKRLSAFVFAVVVAAVTLAAPQAASAAGGGVDCDVFGNCSTHVEDPGHQGGGGGGSQGGGSSADPATGIPAGPTKCENGGKEIPCSSDAGAWNSGQGCYVKVAADQPPAPPGGAPTGAWYSCTPPDGCGADSGRDCFGGTFWSDTPPAGVNTLTPAQAAQQLVKTFQLRGIDVGLAPDPNVAGSKSYVGVPVWMWVNNPQPLTYGPYDQTATLGGVTITAEAKVTSILWNMGDGHTVACGSPGTAYTPSRGLADSPDCGYKYAKTSKGQPGGRYTITATSQWAVTWSGGGDSGTIPITKTSTTTAEIGELQSVNTKG